MFFSCASLRNLAFAEDWRSREVRRISPKAANTVYATISAPAGGYIVKLFCIRCVRIWGRVFESSSFGASDNDEAKRREKAKERVRAWTTFELFHHPCTLPKTRDRGFAGARASQRPLTLFGAPLALRNRVKLISEPCAGPLLFRTQAFRAENKTKQR